MSGYILGDTLMLEVAHGGGCAEHTYTLCFDGFLTSDPVQVPLTIIHDANGDGCNAYLQTTLTFDLSPLGEAYNAAFQTQGGIIMTQFGLYGFGEAECDERVRAASEQVLEAARRADKTCSSAQDCQLASIDTRCSYSCGSVVSNQGAQELSQAIQTINSEVCGDYETDGCTPTIPPCVPPPPVGCVQGQCAALAE